MNSLAYISQTTIARICGAISLLFAYGILLASNYLGFIVSVFYHWCPGKAGRFLTTLPMTTIPQQVAY